MTVDEHDWLAERFEENRGHLQAVAYRMLGSRSEADDAVQESWIRLSRSDPGRVENLRGWLTTVVGRVCLDMLRSRKARREEPMGAPLPEPIVSRARRRVQGATAPDAHRTRQRALVDAFLAASRGGDFAVFAFTTAGGKIVAIDLVADPDRLRRLDLTVLNQ